MGWAVGYDSIWGRDIGYGVPALCDCPGCGERIDRGIAYRCGGHHFYEAGCGLYFCAKHRSAGDLCDRCYEDEEPYKPTPDLPEWLRHKLTDPSWAKWRAGNPDRVKEIERRLKTHIGPLIDQGG